MTDDRDDRGFLETVAAKASRRVEAGSKRRSPLWLGLGSFGTVGWSVAIPTLIGVAVGLWLDSVLEDTVSWTLMGLFAGAAIGCVIAWQWVSRTSRGDSG
jgi:ATP synthase protein I